MCHCSANLHWLLLFKKKGKLFPRKVFSNPFVTHDNNPTVITDLSKSFCQFKKCVILSLAIFIGGKISRENSIFFSNILKMDEITVCQHFCYKDRIFCICFFCHCHSHNDISNVYLLVLSKATGQTLQKHYDFDYDNDYHYDRENKIHAPSFKWYKFTVSIFFISRGWEENLNSFRDFASFNRKCQVWAVFFLRGFWNFEKETCKEKTVLFDGDSVLNGKMWLLNHTVLFRKSCC